MAELIFQESDSIVFGGNTFRRTPVILKFDDTNLVEVVKQESLGLTTQIPIFHSDGTYLAKVVGTRVYATEDGAKAGISIIKEPKLWVCEMGGSPIFEVRQQDGDNFKLTAELFTESGYFVKSIDGPRLFKNDNEIVLNGMTLSGNTFSDLAIGVWLLSDGGIRVGVAK